LDLISTCPFGSIQLLVGFFDQLLESIFRPGNHERDPDAYSDEFGNG
jgi:hypothetical protein